ncbi:MAG: outer membrane protein assembly factor BamD [Sphingomonadales bacterium]
MDGKPAFGKSKLNSVAGTSVKLVLMLLVVAVGLAACSKKPKETKYVERSVEQLYNQAFKALERQRYRFAAVAFDEVERQHPYSVWARRAQLMSAYSHYRANNYDQAILAAQRFLQLHPGNKSAPYAYYLIGVSYYEQIQDVGRDQRMTELAMVALNELTKRFPTSEYARDARLKIDLTLDHLAGKEMKIGRWYLRHDHHLAAIIRFRNVVERYERTNHVPEALHRLTETYLTLGIVKEAQAAAAVLGYNFPSNPWYRDSYALLKGKGLEPEMDEGSWLARLWGKVF